MLKTVIILANTEKRYGRCIAGIDAKSGLPIRLVTANTADDAVPARYCTFSDGRMCEKLDVVRLACEEPDSVATKAIHNTHPCQPENIKKPIFSSVWVSALHLRWVKTPEYLPAISWWAVYWWHSVIEIYGKRILPYHAGSVP